MLTSNVFVVQCHFFLGFWKKTIIKLILSTMLLIFFASYAFSQQDGSFWFNLLKSNSWSTIEYESPKSIWVLGLSDQEAKSLNVHAQSAKGLCIDQFEKNQHQIKKKRKKYKQSKSFNALMRVYQDQLHWRKNAENREWSATEKSNIIIDFLSDAERYQTRLHPFTLKRLPDHQMCIVFHDEKNIKKTRPKRQSLALNPVSVFGTMVNASKKVAWTFNNQMIAWPPFDQQKTSLDQKEKHCS